MSPSSNQVLSYQGFRQNRPLTISRSLVATSQPPGVNKASIPSFSKTTTARTAKLRPEGTPRPETISTDFQLVTITSSDAVTTSPDDQPPGCQQVNNQTAPLGRSISSATRTTRLRTDLTTHTEHLSTEFHSSGLLAADTAGPRTPTTATAGLQHRPPAVLLGPLAELFPGPEESPSPVHSTASRLYSDVLALAASSQLTESSRDSIYSPSEQSTAPSASPAHRPVPPFTPGHRIQLRNRLVPPPTASPAPRSRSLAHSATPALTESSEEVETLEETVQERPGPLSRLPSCFLQPQAKESHQHAQNNNSTTPTAPASNFQAGESYLLYGDVPRGPYLRNRRRFTPSNDPPASLDNSSVHEQFLRLRSLPAPYKPVPTFLLRPLFKLLEKTCSDFVANPSEAALFNFLAIPKLALHPAIQLLHKGTRQAIQHLENFPNNPWPTLPAKTTHGDGNRLKNIQRLVQTGRLGTAARSVRDESKVAEIDEAVVSSLRSKHPAGTSQPFGPSPGPSPGISPSEDDITAAIHLFKPFTAPGISGWTVPLLKVATRAPQVIAFLTCLTGMIGQGTAPGQSMLCASRLTPLAKQDGGVRPIAVGDLIYRLSAKVLLRHHFKQECLLPTQFGVGTKGGVEPVIRTIQRALEGTLDRAYTSLTSLDFVNAFNESDRLQMAASLREYCPSLYRTAKWAYNTSSDLVLGDIILKSASGVRQGDPLGPLFFSLAIRPLLQRLQEALGPHYLILAYLDDIYILSLEGSTLDKVFNFMDTEDTPLRLNRSKCFEIKLEDITSSGCNILGTQLGSIEVQKAFLAKKVDSTLSQLKNLASLPHQHALLLLRQCIQQDLRHLQRTMAIHPTIDGEWARLDEGLWDEVRRIRGRTSNRQGDRQELENTIMALPLRLGGMGLLSHRAVAPLASAASNEASDRQIDSFLSLLPLDTAVPLPAPKTQHERCQEMWTKDQDTLMATLDDPERKIMAESASTLGRKWLNTIPFYPPLALNDFELATAVHYRTLSTSPLTTCTWCAKPNHLGHDEVCLARPRQTVARHDYLARIIHSTLKTIDPSAEHEPHSFEGRRRNDIRLRGPFRGNIDFDIKVYTLMAVQATKTTTKPPDNTSLPQHIVQQATKYLDRVARHATQVRPLTSGRFLPLVFSCGGLMSKETATEVEAWGKELDTTTFQRMRTMLSMALVKARARSFDVARPGAQEDDPVTLSGEF